MRSWLCSSSLHTLGDRLLMLSACSLLTRNAFGGDDVLMTSSGPDGKQLLQTSLVVCSYQVVTPVNQ